MKIKFPFILLNLLFPLVGAAQSLQEIDSLKASLQNIVDVEEKGSVIYKIADAYIYRSDVDSAKVYYERFITETKEASFEFRCYWIGEMAFRLIDVEDFEGSNRYNAILKNLATHPKRTKELGRYFWVKCKKSLFLTQNDSGLFYAQKALKIFEEFKDTAQVAWSYSKIAIAYNNKRQFVQAYLNAQKGLSLNEYNKSPNKLSREISIRSIQNQALYEIGDYKNAIESSVALLNIIRKNKIQNPYLIIGQFNNMSAAYFWYDADTTKSINYIDSLILFSRKMVFPLAVNTGELIKAFYMVDAGDFSKAIQLIDVSRDYAVPKPVAESYLFYVLASIEMNKNNYKLAIENFNKSYQGCLLTRDFRISQLVQEQIIECYTQQGDFKSASETHKVLNNIRDSLRKQMDYQQIMQLKLDQEIAQQQQRDSTEAFNAKQELAFAHEREMAQEKERERYVQLGALFVFIIAVGLFSRLRYVRKSKAVIEKEKDRSENLLHNILPKEVAEELKEKGASEAKDFDEVTVLFSDFKEFTQTAKKLSAKELVSEINACFKAFDAIMQKYQIEKIKTIGDAYMAAGGLHEPRTSEPKDVVLAGVEMQAFMLSRKAEREAKGLPCFDMRVG
ncbi:MAG: hypothetical protein N4A46_10000, partial [Schleiferiaceae bacterium]|nr:hypothetical protein [Schleiferiaceae bacterium]